MSELDADLYGGKVPLALSFFSGLKYLIDLYGDDNEFVVPTEDEKRPAERSSPPAPTAPSTTAKQAVETKPTELPPTTASGSLSSYTESPRATSQIPTYTASTSDQYSNYGHSSMPDKRSSYYHETQPISSSVSVPERSVRPSEMKEEG